MKTMKFMNWTFLWISLNALNNSYFILSLFRF